MKTLEEAMAFVTPHVDALIERCLTADEAQMRHDMAATGPEDEEALDLPPDPGSPWRRITVEEAVMLHREKALVWRAETLETLRAQFIEFLKNG